MSDRDCVSLYAAVTFHVIAKLEQGRLWVYLGTLPCVGMRFRQCGEQANYW